MKQINQSSTQPLYHQIYEILHEIILCKEWKPGEMIPAESELIEQYQVSRITVRRVLDMLVKEGLVYRQRGRGSFVAHPTLEHSLTRIVSFTEDMRQRGFTPGNKLLYTGVVAADQEVAGKLQVPLGEELVQVDRLRLADGEPMCVEQSFLVHRYVPGILKHDFILNSLRDIKQKLYGIRWVRAMQNIHAIVCPAQLQVHLSVKAKTPLLYIERVSFSQQNIPMEYLKAYYRADRYSLYNELTGGEG
jgi:GntR family transcriptional regulator